MTISGIRAVLTDILNTKAGTYGENTTLSQTALTDITNTLASDGLETVNPNGPTYPPKPH